MGWIKGAEKDGRELRSLENQIRIRLNSSIEERKKKGKMGPGRGREEFHTRFSHPHLVARHDDLMDSVRR